LSYFAFNDDIFNCEKQANTGEVKQSVVLLNIFDPNTGEDLSQNYIVEVEKIIEN